MANRTLNNMVAQRKARRLQRSSTTKPNETEELDRAAIHQAIQNPGKDTLTPNITQSLQKTHGNQQVSRMIQKTPALQRSAESHKPGCGCSSCGFGGLVQRSPEELAGGVQRKPEIQRHTAGCGCSGCSGGAEMELQRSVSREAKPQSGSDRPNKPGGGLINEMMHAMVNQSETDSAQRSPDLTGPKYRLHVSNGRTVQRGIFDIFKSKSPREKFNGKKFKLRDWQPSTGGGRFDADYSPATGIIQITSKIHLTFQDMSDYATTAEDPTEVLWTTQGKQEWFQKFRTSVMDVWNNAPQMTCTEEGFEDVVVQPHFEVVQVSRKSQAHYSLTVGKAFRKKNNTGIRSTGFSGVNREGGGNFQEQDVYDKINDPKIAPHLAKTENTINIMPAYTRDRERLEKKLAALPPVTFVKDSSELAPGQDVALNELADAVLALRGSSALSDLHPIIVQFALAGREKYSVIGGRLSKIKNVFDSKGIKNPLVSKQIPGTIGSSATFIAAPESDETKEAYLNNWTRFTSAHEYGHMIGLLDEYCPATSPELLAKMVNEGAIKADEQTLSQFAEGKKGGTHKEQTAYSKLLDKTGLSTPTWARPTADKEEKSTSLMSGGFELLKQHFVTVWEALAQMTSEYVDESNWKL